MQAKAARIKDTEIAERINEELVNNPHISAGNVWIDVKDGNVTLAGTVANDCVKELTERVIKGVDGVEDVDSLLHSEQPQFLGEYQDDCLEEIKTLDKEELKLQKEAMANEGGPTPNASPPAHG